MGIKRENWKGKYRVVQRDSRGKIITHVKWTPGSLNSLKRLAKSETGSIKRNLSIVGLGARVPGKNFAEIQKFGRGQTAPRTVKSSYFVDVVVNGVNASGRSIARQNYPKNKARAEAIQNAVSRAVTNLTFSDVDKANEVIAKGDFKIVNEGIIYYRKI